MVTSTTSAIGCQSWGAHVRATLALGLPLVGSQIAQIAITTTDVVMLGWYGTTELAASVLASQIFFIVFILGAGFPFAATPLASQAEGRQDKTQVRRVVRMGLWLILIYSSLAMPVLWQTEAILLLFGQKPELASLAADYMRIAQWGVYPALGAMGLRAFFSARSRAQVILWATLGGTFSNAILNYMLIFGNWGVPEMGIRGAAIASVASSLAIFAGMAFWVLVRPENRAYHLFQRFWKPDWPGFLEVFRLGWPIGLTLIAEVGLFAAASMMMGWLGTIPLAAHGIAIQLAALSFMVPLGLSNAATVRVGQAHGRGDHEGLRRAALTALIIATLVAVMAAAVFWIAPELLVGFFLDDDNPDGPAILKVAVPLLAVAAAFQLVDALQVMGAGLLRGVNDTRVPMIIAVISYWPVGLSAAYGLGFGLGWGGPGVWMGLAIGLGVAAVALNIRFACRHRFIPGSNAGA